VTKKHQHILAAATLSVLALTKFDVSVFPTLNFGTRPTSKRTALLLPGVHRYGFTSTTTTMLSKINDGPEDSTAMKLLDDKPKASLLVKSRNKLLTSCRISLRFFAFFFKKSINVGFKTALLLCCYRSFGRMLHLCRFLIFCTTVLLCYFFRYFRNMLSLCQFLVFIAVGPFLLFSYALYVIIYDIDIRISFQQPRKIYFVKEGSEDWAHSPLEMIVFLLLLPLINYWMNYWMKSDDYPKSNTNVTRNTDRSGNLF